MKRKLIATLRGLSAVVLMLFATNFLPVAASLVGTAGASAVGPTIEWGQQGRDQADPNCVEGQTANFHFVLAPAGTTINDAGTINVTFLPSGSDSDVGTVHANGAGSYNVSGAFNAVADSATVTGADWTASAKHPDKQPLLTLSDSFCTGTPTENTVTAGVVAYVDLCGTDSDTYTVPSTEHVTYMIGQQTVAADTYDGSGTVTITAVADQGYTLTAPYTFTHTFTDEDCESDNVPVTAGTVTFVDLCGTDNDTYTVPSTEHVTYMIGQQTVAAGTYDGSGTVTVTAHADQGYVLTAPYTFSHNFKDKACKQHVKVFVCKYVGTPGVNERLKKGKNPISVSVKSTGGTAVGSYFKDAQGRSFVLGIDDGEFNPTREDCPPAQQPVEVTPAVQFNEPTCENTNGRVTVTAMNGVTYKVNGTVVTGTTSFPAGSSVTVTTELATGFVLANGVQGSFPHTFAAAPTDCVLGAVTGGRGGDVLGATTTQLANTGQSPWAAIIVGVTVISLTLTSAFASRRVRLDA